jgi:hypothetical protein
MVLDQYPTDVIIYITDPRTGVQRACKWPPTIAEIIEACDKRMHEKARRAEFENWGQRNEPPQLEAPRHERPTLAQLKEKYGEHWGIEQPVKRKPEPCPSWESIITGYKADPERIARLMHIADEHPDGG